MDLIWPCIWQAFFWGGGCITQNPRGRLPFCLWLKVGHPSFVTSDGLTHHFSWICPDFCQVFFTNYPPEPLLFLGEHVGDEPCTPPFHKQILLENFPHNSTGQACDTTESVDAASPICRDQILDFLDVFWSSGCAGPPTFWPVLGVSLAFMKSLPPHPNLCFPHGVGSENILELPSALDGGVATFHQKFECYSLLTVVSSRPWHCHSHEQVKFTHQKHKNERFGCSEMKHTSSNHHQDHCNTIL